MVCGRHIIYEKNIHAKCDLKYFGPNLIEKKLAWITKNTEKQMNKIWIKKTILQ